MLSAAFGALSTGNKVGLAVAAGVFIGFAFLAAYVVPSRWPDFPGGAGLRPFLAATGVLFVGMMLAVFFMAKEEESVAGEHGTTAGGAAHVALVREIDYKVQLPAEKVEPGRYRFEVKNEGKDVHNLAVRGPGVSGKETPTIGPGKTTTLEVELKPGTYELYCSVPGHRDLGMTADLEVG